MAKKKKRAVQTKKKKKSTGISIYFSLFFITIAAMLLFFGLNKSNPTKVSVILDRSFGDSIIFASLSMFSTGLFISQRVKNHFGSLKFVLGNLILFVSISTFLHTNLPLKFAKKSALLGDGAGSVGLTIYTWLSQFLSHNMIYIFSIIGVIVAALVVFNIPFEKISLFFKTLVNFVWTLFSKYVFPPLFSIFKKDKISLEENSPQVNEPDKESSEKAFEVHIPQLEEEPKEKKKKEKFERVKVAWEPYQKELIDQAVPNVQTVINVNTNEVPWIYPSLNLLTDPEKSPVSKSDINESAKMIEETLDHFGIVAKVVEVNIGPSVIQYCLDLMQGIKISKITTLEKDLALALSSTTGSVRIEAPIPGRNLIGIEVPSKQRQLVGLKPILKSDSMGSKSSVLTIAIGNDVSGNPVVSDIGSMPHLLIAGSTGSGKSVMINILLTSLLYRASPQELKLILVDPKRVELSPYKDIPHLIAPVITEVDQILSALRWAIKEMERRYKRLESIGVRNINTYNEYCGFIEMPYIVIVIDEMAEVMMTAPREVEQCIARLAQLSRAVGIHLVLATQRPSVDIITGVIKNNIPCRIAFAVSDQVNSRVIIDQSGAEKLIGKGDMLYIPPNTNKAIRVQGALVKDQEVQKLVSFLKNNGWKPNYIEEIFSYTTNEKNDSGGSNRSGKDPLYQEAMELVVKEGFASTSSIQRKLRIGYNRAAIIMDELEASGVVGEADGSRKRPVLITKESLNSKGKNNAPEDSWSDSQARED